MPVSRNIKPKKRKPKGQRPPKTKLNAMVETDFNQQKAQLQAELLAEFINKSILG